MDFDPTKPVRTRDGRNARIVFQENEGKPKIVALVIQGDGEEQAVICGPDGRHKYNANLDLHNVPVKKTFTGWINVYRSWTDNRIHVSRAVAQQYAYPERIACIEVSREYIVGEGL